MPDFSKPIDARSPCGGFHVLVSAGRGRRLFRVRLAWGLGQTSDVPDFFLVERFGLEEGVGECVQFVAVLGQPSVRVTLTFLDNAENLGALRDRPPRRPSEAARRSNLNWLPFLQLGSFRSATTRHPSSHAGGLTAFSRYRWAVSRMRKAWEKMSLTSSTCTRSSDLFASKSPSRF